MLPGLAIAMAAGLVWTGAATAQTTTSEVTVRGRLPAGVETKHEVVKFADLDLKGVSGAETLVGRIRGAADRVCMPEPTHKADIKDVSDYQACRTGAIAGAVKDSGSALAEEVLKRTGG
jgi:UrcA family protein